MREVATVSHSFTYSMDYFCSVSLGGGWPGADGLGTLELTEPFLFQAGTAQRDEQRKDNEGWDRG